jgi:hypothetical protein
MVVSVSSPFVPQIVRAGVDSALHELRLVYCVLVPSDGRPHAYIVYTVLGTTARLRWVYQSAVRTPAADEGTGASAAPAAPARRIAAARWLVCSHHDSLT